MCTKPVGEGPNRVTCEPAGRSRGGYLRSQSSGAGRSGTTGEPTSAPLPPGCGAGTVAEQSGVVTSSPPEADGRRRAEQFLRLLAEDGAASEQLLAGLTDLRDLAFLGAGLTALAR